ncbi:MAG: DUF503 domain-containing protein [Gammaproteobacteria bacterium]|nr:DUF503 domain-containing protein [Gammaproteobacteria bacterium]
MANKNNNAVVCVIVIELLIPMARSLKDKRKQIKSLKARLKNRFNLSVAETAALDEWQRAVLGISMISNDRRYLEKQCRGIEQLICECREIEVNKASIEWL